MVELIAIVKPFRAEAVLAALAEFGVSACVVREVKGYGRQKRFPDRLTDEQWEAVARDFEADLGAGRRLRSLALTNADEPDASFRA